MSLTCGDILLLAASAYSLIGLGMHFTKKIKESLRNKKEKDGL